MRVLKAIEMSISGYFLIEEIVNYFDVKKCSEMVSYTAFGSLNIFSTAKPAFNQLCYLS
jgi:hypothetical protein